MPPLTENPSYYVAIAIVLLCFMLFVIFALKPIIKAPPKEKPSLSKCDIAFNEARAMPIDKLCDRVFSGIYTPGIDDVVLKERLKYAEEI